MSEPAIEAYEHGYAERSDVTVEFLHAWGRFGAPCTCGEEECEGFQMMHLRDKLIDAGWIAPESTRSLSRGMEQAARGELVDRGSFAQYAEDDEADDPSTD